MALLEHEIRSAAESMITGLHRHLYTRDEYHALTDAAVFQNKRIELIEGEIIDMAPIGDPHAAVTHPLAVILDSAFGDGFTVRNQVPITLGDDAKPSEPQPDIAVVVGTWRDYVARKPVANDIKLIVEVADTSLADDRKIKSALYAAAHIPEYWIVNLVDNQLEVFRDPVEGRYSTSTIVHIGESVQPLHSPGKEMAVAEFMP